MTTKTLRLKPIIKWTGGKRREIKHWQHLIPDYSTYVEPFAGGAAVYWYQNSECTNVLCDYEPDVINLYTHIRDNPEAFMLAIDILKQHNGDHDQMSLNYYHHRSLINLEFKPTLNRAVSFIYITQLAFSGMRRFNKKGEFNVPFGHYKAFNPNITPEHVALLERTELVIGDAIALIPTYDKPGTFMFLDPPYTRTFKTYSSGNEFGHDQQIKLHAALSNCQHAKWMLVINDDPTIRELYSDFSIIEYDLKYGVNIRNRFDTSVKHLVITNKSLGGHK